MLKAAWLYDQGKPWGGSQRGEVSLVRLRSMRQQAVMTHGGFGYAKEYHVERHLRESLVGGRAVSPQLILCFIAERVLGLPKSY